MKARTKIAVFASGFGSNFEALSEAIVKGDLKAEIVVLVCDKKDAYVLERARNYHINTFVFTPKEYASKEEYETGIAQMLDEKEVDLIILAGYMRLIGNVLLEKYRGRIINIHPSLLPAFPGLHAIEKAYEHGDKVFGITIHYVDEGMDTGTIIAQEAFTAQGDETLEEIEEKIHRMEHKLYPQTIQKLIEEKFLI